MRVADFDFDLPDSLIAQTPMKQRDGARLLHVSSRGLQDRAVLDLPALLQPGDVLVLNESKVIPARLFTDVNGRKIEILLHQALDASGLKWHVFAKPARKLKPDMRLTFGASFSADVKGRTPDGQVVLHFNMADKDALFEKIREYGHMPLPPYITREDNQADTVCYQTIFAREEGSVAAPTAGLHFTEDLLDKIRARGVHIARVMLHVGAGTFQPVKVDDTNDHHMHAEFYSIDAHNAEIINTARAKGGKVVAVGTTSLRTLESAADEGGTLQASSGHTRIFITPGYRFKIIDRLMTNFHLPKSTLFMLVSAFCGLKPMQNAYQHAINQQYRFYSYGDTSLLERAI
jgi:S-adenosylmethionine:tRNA ribosyltransferase-isomerase